MKRSGFVFLLICVIFINFVSSSLLNIDAENLDETQEQIDAFSEKYGIDYESGEFDKTAFEENNPKLFEAIDKISIPLLGVKSGINWFFLYVLLCFVIVFLFAFFISELFSNKKFLGILIGLGFSLGISLIGLIRIVTEWLGGLATKVFTELIILSGLLVIVFLIVFLIKFSDELKRVIKNVRAKKEQETINDIVKENFFNEIENKKKNF